jgi:hypothetical protein
MPDVSAAKSRISCGLRALEAIDRRVSSTESRRSGWCVAWCATLLREDTFAVMPSCHTSCFSPFSRGRQSNPMP